MKKRILSAFLALMLCLSLAVSVSAAAVGDLIIETFVLDEADVLTDAEESILNDTLADVTFTYDTMISVVVLSSLDGEDIDEYQHYVFDYFSLGMGDTMEGVMLLVCMDSRQYRIVSNGYAGNTINSAVIEKIGSAIEPDLSAGNYAEAFDGFADQCAYYLDIQENGVPFRAGKKLLIALVVGLVAALIVTLILKGQLKSVYKRDQANVYVKSGSMQLTLSNDLYLYRNVTRTKKESSSSSSGSGPRRSSGGGSF